MFGHLAKPHQKFTKSKIALTPPILIDSPRNFGDDLRGIPSIAPPILKRSDRLVIEIIATRFTQISPKQNLANFNLWLQYLLHPHPTTPSLQIPPPASPSTHTPCSAPCKRIFNIFIQSPVAVHIRHKEHHTQSHQTKQKTHIATKKPHHV